MSTMLSQLAAGERTSLVSRVLLVITIGLFALCGCDLEVVHFAGSIGLEAPLSNASLSLLLPNKHGAQTVAETTTAIGGDWQYRVLIPSVPLRVESTGGTHDGIPFFGHLSAYVPHNDSAINEQALGYDPESIRVNALTTFVDRYMQRESCHYALARDRVARFFQIPPEVELTNLAESAPYFSTAELLERSQSNGGFDAYVDYLLLEVGGGDSIAMLPSPEKGHEIVESTLGTWVGNKLVGGLAGAGGNFLLKKGWSFLLPALGFETFEQSMEHKLSDIRSELQQVHQEIGVLDVKVDSLMNDMHISTAEILDAVNRADLTTWRRLIQNQHNGFIGQFASELQPSDEEIAEFAHAIVDRGELNFDQVLYNLNDAMIGSDLEGVLSSYSGLLCEKILVAADRGAELDAAYAAYEYYFGDLISLYLRGVNLYCNAWEYLGVGIEEPGVRTQWYWENKVQPQLNAQVDSFLEGVERLVTTTADTRTIVTGEYSMFPMERMKVLARADFIAAQFSTKHGFGLVMRVLGDPSLATSLHVQPINTTEDADNDLGVPSYDPLHAANIREWQYPTERAGESYLGWPGLNDHGEWRYKVVRKISFAKLSFPDMSPALLNRYRDKAQQGNFRVKYQSSGGTEFSVLYQLLDRSTGKAADQKTENGVLFGHCIFQARRNPQFKYELQDKDGRPGNWDLNVKCDPANGNVATELLNTTDQLITANPFSGLVSTATGVGYMRCTITSGTAATVPLKIKALVKTKMAPIGIYNARCVNTLPYFDLHATMNLEVDGQAPMGSWLRFERSHLASSPVSGFAYTASETREANLVQKPTNELRLTTRSTIEMKIEENALLQTFVTFPNQKIGVNFQQTAQQYEIMLLSKK